MTKVTVTTYRKDKLKLIGSIGQEVVFDKTKFIFKKADESYYFVHHVVSDASKFFDAYSN